MFIRNYALHACFRFGYFVTAWRVLEDDRVFRFDYFLTRSCHGGNDRQPVAVPGFLYFCFYIPYS